MQIALDLRAARARADTGALLPVAAPIALLAVSLALLAPALVVQDSWLTLVGGREVWRHGLPHADHLTLLAAGHPWVDQQWLAQLILYGAARLGGIGLAFAACLLAVVVAFGLCASIARRRGAAPAAILGFLVWAVVAAPWGLQLRAQALALPLFAFVLWSLDRDRPLPALAALCVWANVHGSVVVGVALVLAYVLRRRSWTLALAPAAIFVSPYATSLPGYYRLMLVDPPFGRYIKEWQRTTPSALTAAFFALALAAVVLAVARRHRIARFDLVVLGMTLLVALDALRGLIWFSLGALAFLPALAGRAARRLRSRPLVLVAAAGVVAALAAVAARPAHAYETRFPAGMLAATGGRTVLADEATSDWLLWHGDARVAYDVRFEILTRAQIRSLLVWRRFGPGWRNVARGYGVVVDDPAHVRRLVASGGWKRLVAGPRIAVAERTTR